MAEYLEFAKQLCLDCGKVIKEGFYKEKVTHSKDIQDFVTEYDLLVEKLVLDRIQETYPTFRFIGEEAASNNSCTLTSEPTWILDPIDGTSNFIARFPYCCISLALYIDKEAVVAVIFNPILNMQFFAAKGQGAFLNDERISVCQPKELMSSLVITDWGSDRNETNVLVKSNNKRNILLNCRGIRTIGSAALSMCMVASGQADVYVEQGIKCWDMAAGVLIITEAGGVVSNIDGSQFDLMTHGVLCSNNPSHIDSISSLITVIDY